jgi:hypothetical protein
VLWKKLGLNGAKWKSISFNRNKKPIGGHELKHFERIKDLGVIMDTRMSFLSHVETITFKSARMFGFMKRISRSNIAYLKLLILFNAIVFFALNFYSLRKLTVVFNGFVKYIYQKSLLDRIFDVSDTVLECFLLTYI